MIRITAMTSSTWTRLPVFGILELALGPRNPSSHSTIRIKMIIMSMGILLLTEQLAVTGSLDRVTVGVATQQDGMC
jgi:hypothetical protein